MIRPPYFIALVIGAMLMLPSITQGPVVTSDSSAYLSAAKNFVQGRGLVDFGGVQRWIQPPLYPVMLSLPIRAGLSLADSANLVNWLSLSAVFLLAWLVIRKATGLENWQTHLAAGLVAATPSLLEAGGQALTEAPFSALAMLVVWLAVRKD